MDFQGIIEGYYGEPWSWDARASLLSWAAMRGLRDYAYAPKDDPKHRAEWREPYSAADLAGFSRLASLEPTGSSDGAGRPRVWFAVSPGLSIDYERAADRAALVTKFASLLDAGVHGFVLAVDDIPPAPGLGAAHGSLASFLLRELDRPLLLVPTDYTSVSPTTYLRELADTCPESVPIGWTGRTVVCDSITVDDAEGRADALGGRAPWLWDNYPVNDGIMADQLFLGPLRGREPGVAEVLCGYLANGCEQPLANRPALASVAAWCAGDSPVGAWNTYVNSVGCRVVAEACDGAVPRSLVEVFGRAEDSGPGSDAAVVTRSWFAAALAADGGDLGSDSEAGPWIERIRVEAELALAALDAPDLTTFVSGPMLQWQRLKSSRYSVLGPRRSFRPVFGQDDVGGFVAQPGCWTIGANALDRLMEVRLAQLEA